MNILLILSLLLSPASANDQLAVTLKVGQKAPFTGTLISPEAAAKLLTDSDADLALCRAESKYLLNNQLNEKNLKLDLKKAELSSCQYRLQANIDLYEKNIDYLQKQAITPSWEKPAWFVGGVLTGVVVFLGSAYALDKIGE